MPSFVFVHANNAPPAQRTQGLVILAYPSAAAICKVHSYLPVEAVDGLRRFCANAKVGEHENLGQDQHGFPHLLIFRTS